MKLDLGLFLSLSLSSSWGKNGGGKFLKRRKDGLFFSNSWRKFATGSTSSTFHVYACMPCISRVSVREFSNRVSSGNNREWRTWHLLRTPSFRAAPLRFQGSQGNCWKGKLKLSIGVQRGVVCTRHTHLTYPPMNRNLYRRAILKSKIVKRGIGARFGSRCDPKQGAKLLGQKRLKQSSKQEESDSSSILISISFFLFSLRSRCDNGNKVIEAEFRSFFFLFYKFS